MTAPSDNRSEGVALTLDEKIAVAQQSPFWKLAYDCAYCVSEDNGPELNAIRILRVLEPHLGDLYARAKRIDHDATALSVLTDSLACELNPAAERARRSSP